MSQQTINSGLRHRLGSHYALLVFSLIQSESIQHTELPRNSYLDRSVIIVVESAHNYSRRSEHRTIHKGNGGVTEHLSLWDPSNDKLAHGYKLQTVHKQQLVY